MQFLYDWCDVDGEEDVGPVTVLVADWPEGDEDAVRFGFGVC